MGHRWVSAVLGLWGNGHAPMPRQKGCWGLGGGVEQPAGAVSQLWDSWVGALGVG
jgi:hypothetical protein